MSHIEWMLERGINDYGRGSHWWVAPVQAQADIAFRRAQLRLRGLIDAGGFIKRISTPIPFYKNKSERLIEVGGALFWFKSADKPDSLYGEDVYSLVGDEITRWKEPSWIACYTTLVAVGGVGKLIGNVRGRRNFAYKLARLAESGRDGWGFHRLTAYDAIEGGVVKSEIIEQARKDFTKQDFDELFLAIAGDDGSNPFGIEFLSKIYVPEFSPYQTAAYGVDLGKSVDWTWIIGVDRSGWMTESHRFQKPWNETEDEIVRIVGTSTPCLVDGTGVGAAVADNLRAKSGNFEPFVFSSTSKQYLYGDLKSKIQGGRFKHCDPILKQELEDMEYQYTRSGIIYAAPEGLHDDGPDAAALALRCLDEYPPIESPYKSAR